MNIEKEIVWKRVLQGVVAGVSLSASLATGVYLIDAIQHYRDAALRDVVTEMIQIQSDAQTEKIQAQSAAQAREIMQAVRGLERKVETVSNEMAAMSNRLDDDKGEGWPFQDEKNSYDASKRIWETSPGLSEIPYPFLNPTIIRKMRTNE